MVDVNLKVPALEKLLDYSASGIGSIAGPWLATWQARQEVKARRITARGEAEILRIRAKAHAEAREMLISNDVSVSGELEIADTVAQRITFQEQKRQANIRSVVEQTASELGDKSVPDSEPDHDWTARFFSEVQDVSSEEMRSMWARVLAGEVERSGSTSVRTLSVLKNLDRRTADLFRKLCSACVFLTIPDDQNTIMDARVPSLGKNAGHNSLRQFGLGFSELNRLNEHGLIISDYNSWYGYELVLGIEVGNQKPPVRFPFTLQDQHWVLVPTEQGKQKKELKVSGVALTSAGRELSRVVELVPLPEYARALKEYFLRQDLQMINITEQTAHNP